MTASQDVGFVYELAKKVLDEHELVYKGLWRESGLITCFEQIPRKSEYLKVQFRNGKFKEPKFGEDLLDLMNWCAFTYAHWKGEVK